MNTNGINDRYLELADKLLKGTITEKEREEYAEWFGQNQDAAVIVPESHAISREVLEKRMWDGINKKRKKPAFFTISGNNWMRYAAVFILVIGTGAYLWTANHSGEQSVLHVEKLTNTIVPGKEVATLMLADGTTILLDSASNGVLAHEGNIQIVKLANGQIAYKGNNDVEGDIVLNSMTTPKGGKYQLQLPDGSRIWLNSASSIRYPAFFTKGERKIYITGEVFIEVAKDKLRPFIVDVNGKSSVEVLGTQFNVNSYDDEADIKTTLIEGSVRVKYANNNFLLRPGQQLNGTDYVDRPNIDQVTAWKNGYLNFDQSDIQTVMRKIARWYDIEVVYKGEIPKGRLVGELPMNTSIEQVLKILSKVGVRFTIEGKKITISQ